MDELELYCAFVVGDLGGGTGEGVGTVGAEEDGCRTGKGAGGLEWWRRCAMTKMYNWQVYGWDGLVVVRHNKRPLPTCLLDWGRL